MSVVKVNAVEKTVKVTANGLTVKPNDQTKILRVGGTGPQGPAGTTLTSRGAWTAQAYSLNDFVSYSGSSYYAKQATLSTDVPGVSSKWQLVASQGAAGSAGATGAAGAQGPSGVVGVTAPITNSGSSTSATIGITTGSGGVALQSSLDSHTAGTTSVHGIADTSKLLSNPVTGYTANRFCGYSSVTSVPTTGTWQTGDVLIALNGRIQVCTAGGSPGSWTSWVNQASNLTVAPLTVTTATTNAIGAGSNGYPARADHGHALDLSAGMTSGANVTSDKAVSASHTASGTSISSSNRVVDAASKNTANGVAGLDSSGQISSAQLPAIAITSVYTVASQAAQLALTAQEGDVAVRTDESKSYIKNTGTAGTMADWTLLQTPLDVVLSVNGNTGAVSITPASIGAATTSHTHAPTDITGTAVITSDSRLTDSRTPTSHASSHASAGSDPITIAQSQVTNLTTDLADKQASSVNLTTAAAQGTASVRAIAGTGSALTAAASDHTHTKTNVGLGNVDNTADTAKPVSTAQQAALDLKAPLASPALTGTPTVPTAAVDTNTTQAASTAFVLAQAGSATPVVNGTATVGTSTRFARADHVHPTDTSRAPVASPTFTGTVTIPGSVAGVVKATVGGVLSQSAVVNGDVSNNANIAPHKLQAATVTLSPSAANSVATGVTTALGLQTASQTGDTTYLSYTTGSVSGTTHTAGYITVNYGCWVLVTAHIAWANATTGQRAMFIRHQDSAGAASVIDRPGVTIPAGALIANTELTYIMKCDTLDTIRLEGRQDSGGNLAYSGSGSYLGAMLRVVVLGQQ